MIIYLTCKVSIYSRNNSKMRWSLLYLFAEKEDVIELFLLRIIFIIINFRKYQTNYVTIGLNIYIKSILICSFFFINQKK